MTTGGTTRSRFDELQRSNEHRVIPVVRQLFADSETPVGIYRKTGRGAPGSFLLESAEQGIWSRFSFIGVSSFGVLTQHGDEATWIESGLSEARAFGTSDGLGSLAPLDAIAVLHERWRTHGVEGLPPLTGGLVGFIGWDAVRQIEHLPDAPPGEIDVPGQALCFVSELIALDHRTGTAHLIVNVLNDGHEGADALWDGAQERLDRLEQLLAQPNEAWLADVDLAAAPDPVLRTRKEDFLSAVVTAKEHIHEGDIFQVVVSQRFDQECSADAIDVYRILRTLNPSPYMYLLSLEKPDGTPFAIVGSSPEALVKVTGGRVITHPIAGSKPRGAAPEIDAQLAEELTGDPKERAEHLMLVDLARNDLLKVCTAGTVAVTEFMRIERYSHIMHLVSTVEGDLDPDAGPIDVFRATFPAGTLSGAPKPRALEIIDALEPARRGVYGGVVGYFAFSGDIDLAIAIRTATIMGGTASVQAGGGLVADSDPESEYLESQNKAAAPLRAVAVANRMSRRS